MADMNLTQAEADALIVMEKHRADDGQYNFPMGGQSIVLPLHSPDKREQFSLDISRGRIDMAKVKMQNRGRQVIVLVRLDLAGAPRRIATRTTRRLAVRTCMYTARATGTDGPILFPLTAFHELAICGGHWMTSCDSVILRSHHVSNEDCSHDRGNSTLA